MSQQVPLAKPRTEAILCLNRFNQAEDRMFPQACQSKQPGETRQANLCRKPQGCLDWLCASHFGFSLDFGLFYQDEAAREVSKHLQNIQIHSAFC